MTQMADAPQGSPQFYAAQLDLSLKAKAYVAWRERVKDIIKRYRDERNGNNAAKRYAMLWSNQETLAPAVLARVPTPVVGRRYKDNDPVGRVSSEVLERAIGFTCDAYDFGAVLKGCRDDFLLVAQGQAWLRYVPHFEDAEPNESNQVADEDADAETTQMQDAGAAPAVVWEECVCDRLNWDDFGTNVARSWAEVWMVWRRAFMTREQLVERFGEEIGKQVPLDWKSSTREDASVDQDKSGDKAAVYEIWDKNLKKAVWLSKGMPEKLLDEKDDPLQLTDFFPCPKPLLGTTGPDTTIPVPDFIYYQDQAQEIDDLTARIDKLMASLKIKGFYPAADKDKVEQLFNAENGTLIPVDSYAVLREKGGLQGMIDWFPVEKVIEVLKACVEARKQLIDDVFQITGISDIMRGDTDPNETASAQHLKSNWGSSRVRTKQNELARFARDIIRLKGEIIANHFSVQTLEKMTDVKLFESPQAKQMAIQQFQMAAQQAQAMGQQPPQPTPDQMRMVDDPTWAEVSGLLRDKTMRLFRIDIETDSTIEPNDQDEKMRRVEFITAVGKFLAEMLPVAQAAPNMLPVIAESLKFLVRGFRVGREMEDVIDKAMDKLQAAAGSAPPPQQGQPGPNPQVEQAKAQAATMSAQAAMGRVQVEAQRVASDHQLGMAQVQAENTRTQTDAQIAMHEAVQRAEEKRLMHEINNTAPMVAPTP